MLKTIELLIPRTKIPSNRARESYVNPIIKVPTVVNNMYPITKLKNPHKTLTNGVDNPFPGGCAKGVGNFLPEMPLTKCGILFARKAPAKKYAI